MCRGVCPITRINVCFASNIGLAYRRFCIVDADSGSRRDIDLYAFLIGADERPSNSRISFCNRLS